MPVFCAREPVTMAGADGGTPSSPREAEHLRAGGRADASLIACDIDELVARW